MSNSCTLFEYLCELFSAARIKDAEKNAALISDSCATFLHALEQDTYTLTVSTGCSQEAAELLRLVASLSSRRITDRIKPGRKYSDDAVIEHLKGVFLGVPVETVVGVFFDSAGRYISTEYLADGTVNASSFLPRKVMDISTRLGASGVILAHNHPRGIAKPSDADIITTASMASVSDAMGISFMGHYVIAGFDHALCPGSMK